MVCDEFDTTEAFEASFDSEYEFEDWMSAVMPSAPWETEEKQPNEYTWEEYTELSLEYQDQFFSWFDTEEECLDWVESVKVEETEPVFEWMKTGKTPDAYSWEEYEDLSLEEQEVFCQWFESVNS